jgi:hypothetical protein
VPSGERCAADHINRRTTVLFSAYYCRVETDRGTTHWPSFAGQVAPTLNPVIEHRAIHEAAHIVVDTVQPDPTSYVKVVLCPRDGNVGYSIAAMSRVRGGIRDYALDRHRDAARTEIVVLLSGPAASHRLTGQSQDESDHQRAEKHANGLAAATNEPAAVHMAEGKRTADEMVSRYWNQIVKVGQHFVRVRSGPQCEVGREEIRAALEQAGL